MSHLLKVHVDIADLVSSTVSIQYTEADLVKDIIIKLAEKFKLNSGSLESAIDNYALYISGIPSPKYFPPDFPIFALLPHDLIKQVYYFFLQ